MHMHIYTGLICGAKEAIRGPRLTQRAYRAQHAQQCPQLHLYQKYKAALNPESIAGVIDGYKLYTSVTPNVESNISASAVWWMGLGHSQPQRAMVNMFNLSLSAVPMISANMVWVCPGLT